MGAVADRQPTSGHLLAGGLFPKRNANQLVRRMEVRQVMNEITTAEPVTEERVSEATGVALRPETPIVSLDQPTSMLGIIAQAATDPRVDVIKMTALLDMQERLQAKQAEADFNAALARMNTDKLRVARSGTVDLGAGKGSYKFAKWEDMDKVIRPIMQREGFTLSFDSQPKDGGGIVVTGTLLHSGGHSRSASIPLALDTGAGRNNLQAMGSTLSYGKRYTAEMLLNIVREDEDDDGKRGGTHFIANEQVEQIRALLRDAGRQEGPFLDRLFSGQVRSVEEIEVAQFIIVKNTLDGIVRQRAAKGAQ